MTHRQISRRRRRTAAVCRRHPSDKPTTGFCVSCLRERLAVIETQPPSVAAAQAPELRRTRSYSARDSSAVAFEQPRRRSCDVWSGCSSLRYLVAEDEEDPIRRPRAPGLKEEQEEGLDDDEDEYGEHEIKSFDNGKPRKFVIEDSEDGGGGESKTMKELIDLERVHHSKKKNGKDLKEIASVLGKKLKGLSLKHQKNKRKEEILDADFAGNSEIHVRNGRSEPVERVLGRRSCDIDSRYSLDVGRLSFEEPRASWDGCLVGKTYPKLPTLYSVTEDAKTSPEDKDEVKDDDEEKNPGGTAQTRDYYSDSRRRRSFDRSSSIKRPGLLEVDELKAISNVKVSPRTVGLFHGAKLLVTEKELRDSNWYSIKNHKPETVRIGAKTVGRVDGEVKQDGFGLKKPKSKWSKGWSIWGLVQRKNQTKNDIKTEKSLKLEGNSIEGSLAESLLKLKRVAKGEGNGDVCDKLIKSYSVSARKSCDGVFHGATAILKGGFEGGRSSCDGLFHGSINGVEAGRRSCHLLQMKADVGTYSPNNLENGMFRFYFTPSRSHKMSKSGKSRMMD
ncbi:PREDICTED: UPF0503 protein At3g09070, chloroplastic [Tarenaya hassleriana]|uniref:UPF0503 protein At3g09070, chloroplastic n=1 Tax=Tarenaya hassleriana TaxID=28532 RepID=UPI00053C21A3|nr:PREDICTED: UPF0503 protein At3g09070, chloroplastic [Tarenaya hassleriana]